jgi:hypothetical protein
MKSLLKTPPNLFQLIEKAHAENPNFLKPGDWHTLWNNREAFTEEQIMDPDTSHCLAGAIVYFTPNAAKAERLRVDVDEFANEILVNSGRKPIPLAIFHDEDPETALRVIRNRAAQESKLYLVDPVN